MSLDFIGMLLGGYLFIGSVMFTVGSMQWTDKELDKMFNGDWVVAVIMILTWPLYFLEGSDDS